MNETKTETKLPASLLDLGKPSLHALSYALRHPDTWPENFVWDYSDCHQCAMGLAHQLWSSIPNANKEDGASKMARTFAMPYSAAEKIFLGKGSSGGPSKWAPTEDFTKGYLWWRTKWTRTLFKQVTPEMVADQIDKYLATAE